MPIAYGTIVNEGTVISESGPVCLDRTIPGNDRPFKTPCRMERYCLGTLDHSPEVTGPSKRHVCSEWNNDYILGTLDHSPEVTDPRAYNIRNGII